MTSAEPVCIHCGERCSSGVHGTLEQPFCCMGCKTVYELLSENGLGHYYKIESTPGPSLKGRETLRDYGYLDTPSVRERVLDFFSEKAARATFHIPSIHCAACVWLLENLFRVHPAIGLSRVNMSTREVRLQFDPSLLPLSGLVGLLTNMGYEPALTLRDLEKPADKRRDRSILLRIGYAGFAFGNVMMMSFPAYLGLRTDGEALLLAWFGGLSLLLSVPVLLFSAAPFWRSAGTALRRRSLNIDFPIVTGLLALFFGSLPEILRGEGPGYLDSFTGLVFFLLIGRWVQQITFDALSFERDYRSYFPIAVTKRTGDQERAVAISELAPGDRVILRNGELIPADGILMKGEGSIDYSFVTGEADPQPAANGALLYAGGRQTGGLIEVELTKSVSQSYLTSLWNDEAFHKPREGTLQRVTDLVGRYFTYAVVLLAGGTLAYWLAVDPATAPRAFVAVLMVACPCALALSAPFSLGTAVRVLSRNRCFVRNESVIERLAGVDTAVLDKTGTLTEPGAGHADFFGAPLTAAEKALLRELFRPSVHPCAFRIASSLDDSGAPVRLTRFSEQAGMGVEAEWAGGDVMAGSEAFLATRGISIPPMPDVLDGSRVFIAINGEYRGRFEVGVALRNDLEPALKRLSRTLELSVVSGDNDRDQPMLARLLGEAADLRFRCSPAAKLDYVRTLQARGRRVLMLGDGLNDAGALRQSDVGMAVAADLTAFCPASDAILEGAQVARLPNLLAFARRSMHVVYTCFAVSTLYNVVGISFAASGHLNPLVAAILMPISSFSVLFLSITGTRLAAKRSGLN